jgi:hypothetical protein
MRVKLIFGVAVLVAGGVAYLLAKSADRQCKEVFDDVFADGDWWQLVSG